MSSSWAARGASGAISMVITGFTAWLAVQLGDVFGPFLKILAGLVSTGSGIAFLIVNQRYLHFLGVGGQVKNAYGRQGYEALRAGGGGCECAGSIDIRRRGGDSATLKAWMAGLRRS